VTSLGLIAVVTTLSPKKETKIFLNIFYKTWTTLVKFGIFCKIN